ncbi:MAG: hypothetical protein ACI9O2_001120 [Flammeovirgaceae bacterium]|jgi:hypothetical protein
MNKYAFMYLRRDNFQWRNVKPLVSLKLANVLKEFRSFESTSKPPLMIFGCARSGTTTLKEILSGHKDIASMPFEANQLWHPKLYPWRNCDLQVPPIWSEPFVFTEASNQTRTERDIQVIRSTLGAFEFLNNRNTVLLKSAMVAFMIPQLLEIVPNMKLVHLHRDGRAVALSLAKKQWKEAQKHEAIYRAKGYWMEFDELLVRMAQHWVEHIEEIQRQDSQLGLTAKGLMLTVSYEKFCEDPKSLATQIARFAALDEFSFDETRYAEVKATNYKFQAELSVEQLGKISTIMESTLKKLGYAV